MQEITQKWFADWSNEYDQTLGNQKTHLDMLDLAVKISKVKDNEQVLDIGCGTGLTSLKFLQAADCKVHGIDLSQGMLDIWKHKIEKLNLASRVTMVLGDITNLNLEDTSFDIVVSTVTLHHVVDKQPVIDKIYRILKPGGRFLMGELDLDSSGDIREVKRLNYMMDFVKEEVATAMETGGVDAFNRMYDNCKKHILRDGEYCISLKMWSELCTKAGLRQIDITPVGSSNWRKVLCAEK